MVVLGSSQSFFKGSFKSGCNLSSISLIRAPLLPMESIGSVKVALNPCKGSALVASTSEMQQMSMELKRKCEHLDAEVKLLEIKRFSTFAFASTVNEDAFF